MALPGGVKQMAITLVAISVLKKVDQEDPRVIAVCRVMFVVYMAISLSVQLYIRACILAKKETAPVTVPPKPASPFAAFSEASAEASAATDAATSPKEGEEEVDATVDATAGTGGRKRRGGAAEPAAEPAEPEVLSTEEYDLSVLASVRRGLLFNALLLSVFHLKMGSLNPLVITSATGLARLMDEPLFQLHVLGRRRWRSWRGRSSPKPTRLWPCCRAPRPRALPTRQRRTRTWRAARRRPWQLRRRR
eukprot:TRINITY_DN1938_c0_g1_i3.p1 TRINITY_DN1938_c0_g1~~TRINITY_DN1938_c0_g1_i3.p1  ORF type:complete len:249 (-),score=91.86 TRINITY_DN1938_c0_g1_i3:278-1024(-)